MRNLRFLETLIKDNEHDYWIVAKENSSTHGKLNDDILLISLPNTIKRGIDINELKLSEIKDIQRTYVNNNIYLTGNYPPFQICVSLDSFWTGFPVKNVKIKPFIIKCLKLESHDISDYEKLMSLPELLKNI